MSRHSDDPGALDELLDFISTSRGFDFSGYKRTSLERRIRKRMGEVGMPTYASYRDYLELHADEFAVLFDTVLINVTTFFRDADIWELLRRDVVPEIARQRAAPSEIRVWCAGCSTGQEAYSLAMTFAEALGSQNLVDRLKIYATDVDEQALRVARQGVYSAKEIENVPAELRERYFEAAGPSYAVRPDVRRHVIFGRHDLTRDAPISRLDLLTCRNTLMYFNAEMQAQIVNRFHFALNQSAYLALGKAEMLLSSTGSRFTPYNISHRVFARRAGAHQVQAPPAVTGPEPFNGNRSLRDRLLRDHALDAAPDGHVVVDVEGQVVVVNSTAKGQFGLTWRDEGRPLKDLELSYRPVELRSLIEQATSERRTVRRNAVERHVGNGDVQYLDVQVLPLVGEAGSVLGTDVTFTDVTGYVRLQEEVKRSRDGLVTAHEELETTNEELQSSIEELETTNEELQSTNEELETTNEELQSTNEELETMNEELRVRSSELDEVNGFLEGVLQGLPVTTIVLDGQLNVRAWNRASEEMWGLRRDEVVGTAFFGLDLGLPTGSLRDPVRACLDGGSPPSLALEATNRRGKPIHCDITCATLSPATEGVVLVIAATPLE